jgi:YceI-like protein
VFHCPTGREAILDEAASVYTAPVWCSGSPKVTGLVSGRHHHRIWLDLTGVAPTAGEGDSVEAILHGQLTIHGVTHEASIPATVVTQPDAIRVRGATPLNLKDYQIGGLSKALGMLKMDNKILVHIDLTFAPTAPTVGSAIVEPQN